MEYKELIIQRDTPMKIKLDYDGQLLDEVLIKGQKKSKDEFVECALVHNYQYGTLKSYINERIDNGINIILDIDVQGFEQIKNANIDNISVFIIPPSIKELKNRLNIRALDSQNVIETRLKNARYELRYANDFDFRILNDEFDEALESLVSIIFSDDLVDIDNKKSTKIL